METAPTDFEACERCPWCASTFKESWGRPLRGFTTSRCLDCDVLYLDRRLTRAAQAKFYDSYLTEVHEDDARLNQARARMYELEFDLIARFVPPGRVLDVGCSRGGFLEVFAAHGFEAFGVEFGREAAEAASERFEVWHGELPELDLRAKFDLVVMRGVIEHVHDPRAYLDAAWSLLEPGGTIFITSTPNRDAFCCDLFRERWNQHEPEGHLFHLAARHLDAYFVERGAHKLFERELYLETPYANPTADIAAVNKALRSREAGAEVDDTSPPFFGNMLSAAYRVPCSAFSS